MRQASVSYYRKMSMLCSATSFTASFGLSVVLFCMTLGFISPVADAKEWYHVAICGFTATTFFVISIYNFLCIIDDMRPGFLKNGDRGTTGFALMGLGCISLGILMACWFQKILGDLHEKNWLIIIIYHSFGTLFFVLGAYLMAMSRKFYRIGT